MRCASLLAALALLACGEGWGDEPETDPTTTTTDAPTPGAVTCGNPAPKAPSSGTCAVQPGQLAGALLIQGTLLLPDRTLVNGHLLLVGTQIACAGCDCSQHAAFAGATALSCPGGVVSPGLINPHDHLGWTRGQPVRATVRYDHRHEWRKGLKGKPKVKAWQVDFSDDAMAWGELRHLLGGATSIMGEGSVDRLLRNLDWDNEGLNRPSVKNTTFPLGDKDGQQLTAQCSYPALPDPAYVKKAVAWVPHVAEGVNREARNEFTCLSGGQAGAVDVTLSNTSLIHAVGITAADARLIAKAGARVIWSPRSNVSLYGMTADVVMLHNLGVPVALGTDWVISGSMNLLRELACADHLNRVHYGGALSERQLWEMVTKNAALAAGLDGVIGELKAGQAADVTIFSAGQRRGHAAVIRARVPDVALVLRGGEVLYGDAALVAALAQNCEPLDVCKTSKRLCLKRELGKTLAELEASLAGQSYPLFFCGEPEGEPSCVPSRPGEYDGKPSATDADGDGVAAGKDNCPTVFNPPRPLDNKAQADADGDGVGDACDPTP